MPKGIVTVRWDDNKGTVLKARHPDDLQLTADEMMRIFTSHAMGEGKPGFMSMKLEAINVASYYTGLAARGEAQHYIALILGSDEDAGIFEEPLTELARELIKNLGAKNYEELLIKAYGQLTTYVKLTSEQRLAMIVADPPRKLILKKLTEQCASKLELQEWLEEELGTQVADIDLLLIPLVKATLVKKATVEGLTGDCVFLVRDVFAAFTPPAKIMSRILKGEIKGETAKSIRSQISDYFKKREPSENDVSEVTRLLTDTDLYEVISKLRENIASKEELAEQLGKSQNEIQTRMRGLIKQGIVGEVSDTGRTAYLLLADPQISLFFPEYMIDNIRAQWASGEVSKEMAVRYLQLLKEGFITWTEKPTKT